tara:strand:+ start:2209 stop:2508 length:300 start_codon:yes stop_codon:yes gene_type:complete
MRRFKLIRLKDVLEAKAWDSVSVAVNNTKMVSDSVVSVVTNNLVNSCLLDFYKKLNKFIISASKRRHLLNNNSSNNNILKTSITNSHAGDWNAAEAFGN